MVLQWKQLLAALVSVAHMVRTAFLGPRVVCAPVLATKHLKMAQEYDHAYPVHSRALVTVPFARFAKKVSTLRIMEKNPAGIR